MVIRNPEFEELGDVVGEVAEWDYITNCEEIAVDPPNDCPILPLDGVDRGRVDDGNEGWAFEMGTTDFDNAGTVLPQETSTAYRRLLRQRVEVGLLGRTIRVPLRIRTNTGLDSSWSFAVYVNGASIHTEALLANVDTTKTVDVDVLSYRGQTITLEVRLVHTTVLPLDELYFTRGTFLGDATVGGESLSSVGAFTDAYAARFHADGTAQWVAPVTSLAGVRAWQTAVDPETAESYVAYTIRVTNTESPDTTIKNADGTTFSTLTSFLGVLAVSAYDAMIIVKYDPDGDVLWATVVLDALDDNNVTFQYHDTSCASLVLDGNRLRIMGSSGNGNTATSWQRMDLGAFQRPTHLYSPTGDIYANAGGFLPFCWTINTSDGLGATDYGQMFSDVAFIADADSGVTHNNVAISDALGPRLPATGRSVWPIHRVGFPTEVRIGTLDGNPGAETLILSAIQMPRYISRERNGDHVAQIAVAAVLNPSTTPPSNDTGAGSMTRMLAAEEKVVVAASLRENSLLDEVRYWDDSATVMLLETEDQLYTGGVAGERNSLSFGLFSADLATRHWSRSIPQYDASASALYGVQDVAVDEEAGFGYLITGLRNICAPEWDGTALNEHHQAISANAAYALIKFSLSTGATEWWAFTDITDGWGRLHGMCISLTDEHVCVGVRFDSVASHADNGFVVRNSNLDAHRAAGYVARPSTFGDSQHIVRYTKRDGLFVDAAEIATTPLLADTLDALDFLPPPVVGYAVEPASPPSASLTPGSPVFSVEAVSVFGKLSGAFLDRISPTSMSTAGTLTENNGGGGTFTKGATGGPGGGADHNVDSNLHYWGLTGSSAARFTTATTSLVQPGIVLICAQVTTIGTRQVLLSGDAANWEIAVNASGYLEVNAGTLLTASGTALTSGQWFYAAIKVDGNNSAIASSVAQSASGAAGANALDDVRLFNNPANTAGLVGRANTFKIWSGTTHWAAVQAYAAARWDTL